jgi:hypothetical protein
VDISLEGCCIRTKAPFTHGALAYVEVILHIYGLVLRIGGVTQWTRQDRTIGIRFILPTVRSKNELAGLLTCLVDKDAAEDIKQALVSTQVDPLSVQVLAAEMPKADAIKPTSAPIITRQEEPSAPQKTAPVSESPQWTGEESDWTADMRFIKDGSHLRGTIVNLRMDGCGFRLADPYKGDYPCRVEVEFRMRGLPFRAGGVTEYVDEKCVVGVRFLGMIAHRKEKLAQLLDEIREAEEQEAALAEAELKEAERGESERQEAEPAQLEPSVGG